MAENEDHDRSVTDLLWSALPEAGRRQLEENMSAGALEDTKSQLARCIEEALNDSYAAGEASGRRLGCAVGKGLGRAEGRLEAVLTILDARRIDVPDHARERITAAASIELREWIPRAATGDSVDDLFV